MVFVLCKVGVEFYWPIPFPDRGPGREQIGRTSQSTELDWKEDIVSFGTQYRFTMEGCERKPIGRYYLRDWYSTESTFGQNGSLFWSQVLRGHCRLYSSCVSVLALFLFNSNFWLISNQKADCEMPVASDNSPYGSSLLAYPDSGILSLTHYRIH